MLTLGFETTAPVPPPGTIKAKYRDLAQRFHPDVHTGAAEKAVAEAEFKKIGNAAALLKLRWQQRFTQARVSYPNEHFGSGVSWRMQAVG